MGGRSVYRTRGLVPEDKSLKQRPSPSINDVNSISTPPVGALDDSPAQTPREVRVDPVWQAFADRMERELSAEEYPADDLPDIKIWDDFIWDVLCWKIGTYDINKTNESGVSQQLKSYLEHLSCATHPDRVFTYLGSLRAPMPTIFIKANDDGTVTVQHKHCYRPARDDLG